MEGATLWLSSYHDDGTPGSVVVIFVEDIRAVFSRLDPDYPHFNPAIGTRPVAGWRCR